MTPDSPSASVVLIAGLGLAAFVIATNGISASAISRDGSNYIYSHFVPVRTGICFGQASARPCGELSFRSAYTGRRLCRDRSVLAFVPYLLADLILIVLCINLFDCLDSRYPKVDWRRRQRLSSRIST